MNSKRIEREKRTVEQMVRLYCKHKEKNRNLCCSCRELLFYAHQRLDHCPFNEKKKACRHCKIHCYKPVMREKMRIVMRYAGPRMFLYAPLEAIRHLLKI